MINCFLGLCRKMEDSLKKGWFDVINAQHLAYRNSHQNLLRFKWNTLWVVFTHFVINNWHKRCTGCTFQEELWFHPKLFKRAEKLSIINTLATTLAFRCCVELSQTNFQLSISKSTNFSIFAVESRNWDQTQFDVCLPAKFNDGPF